MAGVRFSSLRNIAIKVVAIQSFYRTPHGVSHSKKKSDRPSVGQYHAGEHNF